MLLMVRKEKAWRSSITSQQADDGSNVEISSEGSTGITEQQAASSSSVGGSPSQGKVASTPSRGRRRSASSSLVPPSPARITRAMRKAGVTTPKEVAPLEVVPELPVETEDHPVQSHDEPLAPTPKAGIIVGEIGAVVDGSSKQRASSEAITSPAKDADSPLGNSSANKSETCETLEGSVELAMKSHEDHVITMEKPPRKSKSPHQKKSPVRVAVSKESPGEDIPSLAQETTKTAASPLRKVGHAKSPRRTPMKESMESISEGAPESSQQVPSVQSPMDVDSVTKVSSPRRSLETLQIKSPTLRAVSELLQKDVIPAVEASISVDSTEKEAFAKTETNDWNSKGSEKNSFEGEIEFKQTVEEPTAEVSDVEFLEEVSSPKKIRETPSKKWRASGKFRTNCTTTLKKTLKLLLSQARPFWRTVRYLKVCFSLALVGSVLSFP
ncbi:hypothetical protein TELCIR_10533 [Teladorsagia circumcincta]|uniref:Uncharacterized protein n=1 Tax=Teladorsagia circumcincta TaxID=45464 RepID=A0A2G9UBV6_TELCI|nr:hypothetical protein TELCIR_10533 [Teladorsagia circumcincta]